MDAWLKTYRPKRRKTPDDQFLYLINMDVLRFTERILLAYGNISPSNEGIVYWAGTKKENVMHVSMAVAPNAISNPGMVKVPHLSNLNVVLSLSQHKNIHLGQVHSHPTEWVDHSPGDDTDAAFKVEGLLSIVVPNYGHTGMQDILTCGFHRFHRSNFIRLSNKYVKSHFKIIESNSSILIDQRYERVF